MSNYPNVVAVQPAVQVVSTPGPPVAVVAAAAPAVAVAAVQPAVAVAVVERQISVVSIGQALTSGGAGSGGDDPTWKIVFTNGGDVALRNDGAIVTARS